MILAILSALPALARTVEIKAFSRDTWIAWRAVSFQSARGALSFYSAEGSLPATCIKQSSGKKSCSGLTTADPVHGWWNADSYSGTVTFRVDGSERIEAVRLVPCCGDMIHGFYPEVAIEIRIDGRIMYRAFHAYSLEWNAGWIEISIPYERR